MNPACGPPNPIGTPKRCELPTAMSAPSSPGDLIKVNASKSVITPTSKPALCAFSITELKLVNRPLLPG